MINSILGIQTTPEIITLNSPIKMIGVSMPTSMKTIFSDAVTLGKRYETIKNQNIIPNQLIPWAFVAISKDIAEDGTWVYLMGAVVTSMAQIPAGLEGFEIPPQTYVRFKIRPRLSSLWGLTIGLTKKYVYTQWLPNSEYDPAPQPIGEFEYHDIRSLAAHPEIDLMVSIKRKPNR